MKFVSSLIHRLRWVNLPGALLIALLQRTPALRVAAAAGEMVAASPVGALLRSAVTAAASLGAVHALAGATHFVFSPNTTSVSGTVGQPVQSLTFTVVEGGTNPSSFRVTGLPPGVTMAGANANGVVNSSTPIISGTPTASGTFFASITAYEFSNGPAGNGATSAFGPITVTYTIAAATTGPTITTQPANRSVAVGDNATLSVVAAGSPAPTYQWQRNGVDVAGATVSLFTIGDAQPGDTGLYRVVITNSAGSVTSQPAIVGISSTAKLVGAGTEFPDIVHTNGTVYDQILLGGNAATVTADAGQVLRISYLDVNDDIVQVEFSGAGALTLALDPVSVSGPAAPVNYNQSVLYMKGHASIVIAGADETTNLGVFSVGRLTAVNQALFKDTVTYDGFADIAFVAITSPTGKFAGLRTANASYFATRGYTGIYAPGVAFVGGPNSIAPVFIGDISAFDTATPVLLLGSGPDTSIRGGDLSQANGQASPPAVQVSGISELKFVAGSTSHGLLLPAQTNKGVLMQNGTNVTSQIVVNPSP